MAQYRREGVSVNHVILMGRLSDDWHFSKTLKNVSVGSNILVTAEKKSDGSTSYEYHEITAWADVADQIVKCSGKGDALSLTGKIVTSVYVTKTGKERRSKKIHIQRFYRE